MADRSCELITRALLASVDTSRTIWVHIDAALHASHQEQPPQHFIDEILDASVRNPCALAAPRDPRHLRKVVLWLAEQWRTRGWKVPKEFQLESLPAAENTPDLFYKTYVGWGGGAGAPGMTLLESGGGITHHTTGLTTWCGAAVLAEWVANNPMVVAGRRVLELGAGVGFSAAAMLTSPTQEQPPPAAYIATDCHHHVLTLLHHNLTLNLAEPPLKRSSLDAFQARVTRQLEEERAAETEENQNDEPQVWSPPEGSTSDPDYPTLAVVREAGPQGHGLVGVMQVDWRSPPRLPPVDVILAADVVYCRQLLRPLVTLLRVILEGSEEPDDPQQNPEKDNERQTAGNGGSLEGKEHDSEEETVADGRTSREPGGDRNGEVRRGRREAFLACTRRSHETLGLFLQEVARQGLQYSLAYQATLDADTALFVYNEMHLPIKVYRITLPEDPFVT
ncbi:protein-lysine N-methyltransferase EEF2KMT-like [Eriocheir sinensis]|uniref:protein-lysine N-methyltransferase EEF2KMT-like n=1 Tax=Eriocheir sinensis TaxID=95602 RepID=UPI0021C632BC|nr:protein-lysine N-methyltransferase EEF2KMT-like [Eriocheir sinensis]